MITFTLFVLLFIMGTLFTWMSYTVIPDALSGIRPAWRYRRWGDLYTLVAVVLALIWADVIFILMIATLLGADVGLT